MQFVPKPWASIPFRAAVCIAFFCGNGLGASLENSNHPVKRTLPAEAIVIGFVGGMVQHNNLIHSEVRLATHLQNEYSPAVQVRMFENRRGARAEREIRRLLDVDHDGGLSAGEKRNARIAIYGHSWGASETVALARALGKEGIPVLLTVQVDSIAKPGENDELIPANVARAANFYQGRGLLHGRRRIRAADGSNTQILGNFQFDYKLNSIDCPGYPWYARLLMKPHIEIESDPNVWRQVESLIRLNLHLSVPGNPIPGDGAQNPAGT